MILTNTEKERAVEAALRELGGTAREVADTLAACKVQATISDAGHCGIAEWLKYRLSAASVTVGMGTCVVDGVDVDLPAAVVEFVAAFDDGEFPEIVDPAVPLAPCLYDLDRDD